MDPAELAPYALPAMAAAAGALAYLLILNAGLVGRLRLHARPLDAPLMVADGPPIGARLDAGLRADLAGEIGGPPRGAPERRIVALFAAAMCSPCSDLLPDLAAAARRWRGEARLVVVLETDGVAANHPAMEPWERLGLPMLLDPEGDLAGRLSIRHRPLALLLDPSGLVLMKGIVSTGRQLDALLQERGVAPADAVWKVAPGSLPSMNHRGERWRT